MGIIKNLFNILSSSSKQDEPINAQSTEDYKVVDKREAICPYCKCKLDKIPGRKTKCPKCKKDMYVRTNPKGIRSVVTEEEAEKIDEEWSLVSGSHDDFIKDKEEFESAKKELTKRFGKEPSDNDIKWGLLNKKLMEHAQNMQFGLYRNARLDMADILRKEHKLKAALNTYLEVCYIDLNGPNNCMLPLDTETLKLLPPFDPEESAFLAPAVVDYVKNIIKKLEIKKDDIKNLFLTNNNRVYKALKLPLSPDNCWDVLWKEIKNN